MATIAYVVQAINKASRVFEDIATSAAKMDAAMDAAQRTADQLNSTLAMQNLAAGAASAGLEKLAKSAYAASAAMQTFKASAADANAVTATSGATAAVAYGRWGLLSGLLFNRPKTPLFGGALTALGLPAFIAAAGAVHIATDAVIEFTAVVVPATLALAAFGVASASVWGDIYTKLHAVLVTSTALGQNVYPMTGGFDAMAKAVQPEVYQLLGEGLIVVQHSLGLIIPLAVSTGKVLDSLGARAAAALTSGGLNGLLRQGPADLGKIGDIIASIFGTVGNLLKTMPGYAQTLLGILDGLARGLEAITASPITQWLVRAGLYFHGFILYVGLAATGAVFLGNALLGLAARFGLVAAGTTVFNAAMFGAGIKTMLAGTVDLGAAMFTLAGGEAVAAGASRILAGAFAVLDSVNPLVWVAAVGAAIGFVIYQLVQGSQATKQFVSSVQGALGGVSIGSLATNIAGQQAYARAQVASSQKSLNALLATGDVGANSPYVSLNAQAVRLGQTLADNKALLPALNTDQANYSAALKASGRNLSLLNAAGITSNDLIGASAQQMKQYIIEINAAAAAQKALSLGTGRSAAAQNAQTNDWMTSGLQAMNNVISAEDAITSMIIGGQQGFVAFEQAISGVSAKLGTPPGLAAAAKVAGSSLNGLNAQSVNLRNNFYNDAIPAAQSLIDKLEQQNISTSKLRTVVATEVAQMVPFTKGNMAARSVMVDLINNALGPGTVSLQSMNGWLAKNKTSLDGFNSIVAKSTINAGNLAGVLKGLLNQQFDQLLYVTSGVGGPNGALAKFTADLLNSGASISKTASDRATLIKDLEKTGLNARTARQDVRDLENQVAQLRGKTVGINVTASGNWSVIQSAVRAGPQNKGAAPTGAAAGMYVTGGTPGKDSVLIRAMPGELVVPTALVNAGAVAHLHGQIPGYAAGGVVGSYSGTPPGLGAFDTTEYGKTLTAVERSTAAAAAAAMKAAQVASAFGGSVYGASSGGANAALARRMMPAWGSGAMWNAWNYVGMRESGWNAYAANPTSNARGIAQNIAGWGPNYQPGNAAQQIAWMIRYITTRYGNPVNAAAHERGFNWYGGGLTGGIFRSPTVIGVGESGPETVSVTPGSGGGSLADLIAAVRQSNKLLNEIAGILEDGEGNAGAAVSGVPLAGAGQRAAGYRQMYSTRG